MVKISIQASQIASGFLTSTKVTCLLLTIPGIPPTEVTTIGSEQAAASQIECGKPSCHEGKIKISHFKYALNKSLPNSLKPTKSTLLFRL